MEQSQTHIYLLDQTKNENGDKALEMKGEVTKTEVDSLFSTLGVSGIYHGITQIRDIVVQNGKDFQDYMSQENLEKMRASKVSRDSIIINANKLVLNYATSLKAFIDRETRILTRRNKKAELQLFKELCSKFYDEKVEYRFWMNLRDYVVHCDFPYNGFRESLTDGCRLICTKEHLLAYKKWKHSEKDILEMDNINLPDMVIEMSSLIMVLYFDFFTYFGKEILDSLSCYSKFCENHNVEAPAFVNTQEEMTEENFTEIMKNGKLRLPPVGDVYKAYCVLKDNPCVRISYQQADAE